MHMSFSKFWEIVNDGEAWCATVHWVTKSWTWLSNWTTHWPPETINTWTAIQQLKDLTLRRQQFHLGTTASFPSPKCSDCSLLQGGQPSVSAVTDHRHNAKSLVSFPNRDNFNIRNGLFELLGHFRIKNSLHFWGFKIAVFQTTLLSLQQISVHFSLFFCLLTTPLYQLKSHTIH